jgi:hypothetical protein
VAVFNGTYYNHMCIVLPKNRCTPLEMLMKCLMGVSQLLGNYSMGEWIFWFSETVISDPVVLHAACCLISHGKTS